MAATKLVDPFTGYFEILSTVADLVDAFAGGSGFTLITNGEAAGRILSVRSILLSPSGQNTLSITDTDGNVVLPRLTFDTAGGVFVESFLRGHLVAAPDKGLILKATAAAGVSAVISVWSRPKP